MAVQKKVGPKSRYGRFFQRLKDDELYSPQKIVRLLQIEEGTSHDRFQAKNISSYLYRLARHYLGKPDGKIEGSGFRPQSAYFGREWKTIFQEEDLVSDEEHHLNQHDMYKTKKPPICTPYVLNLKLDKLYCIEDILVRVEKQTSKLSLQEERENHLKSVRDSLEGLESQFENPDRLKVNPTSTGFLKFFKGWRWQKALPENCFDTESLAKLVDFLDKERQRRMKQQETANAREKKNRFLVKYALPAFAIVFSALALFGFAAYKDGEAWELLKRKGPIAAMNELVNKRSYEAAWMAYAASNYQEAEELLEDLPQSPRTEYLKGLINFDQGKDPVEHLLSAYDGFLGLDKEYAATALARHYMWQGDLGLARNWLDRAPTPDAYRYFIETMILIHEGYLDDALIAAQQYHSAFKANGEKWRDAEGYLTTAFVYALLGQKDEAIIANEQAIYLIGGVDRRMTLHASINRAIIDGCGSATWRQVRNYVNKYKMTNFNPSRVFNLAESYCSDIVVDPATLTSGTPNPPGTPANPPPDPSGGGGSHL